MRPTSSSSSSSSPDLPCPRAAGRKRARIQAACPSGTLPRLPSTWPVPRTQVADAGDTLAPSLTRLPGYACSSPLSHFRGGPSGPPSPLHILPASPQDALAFSWGSQSPPPGLPLSSPRTSEHWVVPLRFWVTLYLNHPPKDLHPPPPLLPEGTASTPSSTAVRATPALTLNSEILLPPDLLASLARTSCCPPPCSGSGCWAPWASSCIQGHFLCPLLPKHRAHPSVTCVFLPQLSGQAPIHSGARPLPTIETTLASCQLQHSP